MRRAVGIVVLLVIVSIIPLLDIGECVTPVVTINEPREGHFFPPGNVSLNWSAQFDQTELDHFEIRINDRNWTDVGINSTFNVTDPVSGNNTVTVRAYDNETFGEANISFFIDDAAPVIEITFPMNGSLINSSTINATWSIIDEASGVQSARIKIDEGPWIFVNDTDNKVFRQVSDGDHSITIEAVDNVGNIGISSIDLSVDTILPSVIDYGPLGLNVERDEIIFAIMEEAIDPESVEFKIIPSTDGNLVITDMGLGFAPRGRLVPGYDYTVIINFTDLAGNKVGPFEWKFRIADPVLQGKVKGYVVDSYGGSVSGALVTIGNVSTLTNTFGIFDLEIVPGDHLIKIEKENYTTYESNLTLLPTQELDLGKVILEGGTSLVMDEDEDHPWMVYVLIVILIVGFIVAIFSTKKLRGGKDRKVEE